MPPLNSLSKTEDAVRAWLVANSAKFFDSKTASDFVSGMDFLVTKPIPFAIEVLHPGSQMLLKQKSKRMLANRIGLANSFSSNLPLIAVIPDTPEGQEETLQIPFADATFNVSRLPSIEAIKSIRPNATIQDILSFGSDEDVKLTTLDEFRGDWSEIISVSELETRSEWRQDSIALELHEFISSFVCESERRSPDRRGASPTIRALSSPRIEEIFKKRLEVAIGGKERNATFDITPETRFRFTMWEAANGKRFVVRRTTADDQMLSHKTRELLADARILRSLGGLSPSQLILNIIPHKPWIMKTIAGSRIDLKQLSKVNKLEAAGWTVFPADFNHDTPAFIAHMVNEVRQ
jgi:hypothetical protein